MTAPVSPPILPEAVRRCLADHAATVLGRLSGPEVPPELARIRSFAPARRARAGARQLGVVLERDPVFRQRVASDWRALYPDLSEAVDSGVVPGTVEPALALVGVYLLRPAGWERLAAALVDAVHRAEDAEAGRRSDLAWQAEAKAAREEADRLRDLLDREREASAARDEQIAGLRRELRRQRSDADRARAAARAATERAATERAELKVALEEAEAARREASERVLRASEHVEQCRRAEREGRSLADTRARLLLDTVVDAAAGLRRELALPPVELHPADLVHAEPSPAPDLVGGRPGARGMEETDPGWLAELLAMPRAHLIVDGYNVTKSGYGTLPLVEQRRRLTEGLTGLAARTGAEITCCFDGAEVEVSPAWRVRGVRVLFSAPGVTADDLVRSLVGAEPPGRVVIVVSTDGEVARGVRARGAYAVPSLALLKLLARG
jgi:predicted RNA-binding protein with PIN domain